MINSNLFFIFSPHCKIQIKNELCDDCLCLPSIVYLLPLGECPPLLWYGNTELLEPTLQIIDCEYIFILFDYSKNGK